MKALKEIKEILEKQKPLLRESYGVKEIGLFGSYVSGKHKKNSDLDVLVDFDKPVGFLGFMKLEGYLTKITGVKVDLVMKDALKPRIGQHILKEVINI